MSSSRIDLQGRMGCPKRPGHIRHWLAVAPDRPCIPFRHGHGQRLEQAFPHTGFGRALCVGNLGRQPMKHRSSSFVVAPLHFQDDGLMNDPRSLAEGLSCTAKTCSQQKVEQELHLLCRTCAQALSSPRAHPTNHRNFYGWRGLHLLDALWQVGG